MQPRLEVGVDDLTELEHDGFFPLVDEERRGKPQRYDDGGDNQEQRAFTFHAGSP